MDITNKYLDMIHSFECDFACARRGEANLVRLYEKLGTDSKLDNDIDLLVELSYLLRHGKAKIIKIN